MYCMGSGSQAANAISRYVYVDSCCPVSMSVHHTANCGTPSFVTFVQPQVDEEIAPLRNTRREDALKSATENISVAMDDSRRELEEQRRELAEMEAQV